MTEITARLSTALADRYKLDRHLGEGGMATVYLAHDLKHDRKVAIKVLRAELAAVLGADRFVQEIRTTANLQHPHILPLFDSGEADGFLYYVMPFIEGETLRDKLNCETQLGIEEAVKITTEVADALDYAHRHNVIHRDIKPENILLHDGRPMVADFGIALAVSAAAGGRMTETGLSLGTPHYMSPEQATAEKDLTNRSDIYSLGVVLYEMLTGDPPHTGSSAQQIIMKIVTDEARPVTELRKSVPPNVAAAIATVLQKLPADRFASAPEFAEALGDTGYVGPAVTRTRQAVSARKGDWRLLGLAAALVVAIGAAVWGWLRPVPAPPVSRFPMGMPPPQQLRIQNAQTVVVSPDGSRIVYVGPGESGNQLWVRKLDDLNATPIPGTERAHSPFLSPDGQSVAFYRDYPATLHVVALAGGPPLALADGLAYHGSWARDGHLYVLTLPNPRELARLPAGGGPLEVLIRGDTNRRLVHPRVLPNSRGVLFTDCGPEPTVDDCDIRILDLESGEHRVIIEDAVKAKYAPPGFVVYVQADGVLLAAPFDQHKLEVTGPSTPLLEGLLYHPGGPDFDFSQNGTLVYLAGDVAAAHLMWVARDGTEEVVDSSLNHAFSSLALSPDGTRIALSIGSDVTGEHLWLYEIRQATLSRLSFQGTTNLRAEWLPDGQELTFVSNATGEFALHTIPADGSGPPQVTLALEREIWEASWSRDGRWLVFRSGPGGGSGTGRDIQYLEMGVDTMPRTFLASEFDERNPKLSPDGRWLAYVSNESGRWEVYVRPFPGPGGRWQVSTDGGTEPLWARSGQELVYRSLDGYLMRAEVMTGTNLSVGPRTPLFPVARFARDGTHTRYDISPDDRRFLMIKPSETSHEVFVVLNWFTELEERMRGAR